MKDYYDILGTSKVATQDEIRKAYRKKAMQLHPDVNPAFDSHDRFVEVGEAYEILSNATARKEYDMIYEEYLKYESQQTKQQFYTRHDDFSAKQRKARETAEYNSNIPLKDILEAIKAAGKVIILGEEDAPKPEFGDYVRYGFFGLIMIIGIALMFTGFLFFMPIFSYLFGRLLIKDCKFVGLKPFIISTLIISGAVILLIVVFLLSIRP